MTTPVKDQFTVTGHAPGDLDPLLLNPPLVTDPADPGVDYDPAAQLTPLLDAGWLAPVDPTVPVGVTRHRGLTSEKMGLADIAELVATTMDPEASTTIEQSTVRALAGQLSLHASPKHNLAPHRIFLSEALGRVRLPAPSPNVHYTIDQDLVPAAKTLLSDHSQAAWDHLLIAIGAIYNPRILGVGMVNEAEFTAFKAHLATLVQMLTPHLSQNTQKKFVQFNRLELTGLTEAQLLRTDALDDTEDHSFARVLVYAVMTWMTTLTDTTTAPLVFHAAQLLKPEAIVFVNVDVHAHTPSRRIDAEWKLINEALNMAQPPLSLSNITKLTAVPAAMQKMRAEAARSQRTQREKEDDLRRQVPALRRTQPRIVDITNQVDHVLAALGQRQMSQNIHYSSTKTSSKQSRRRPDSPDALGVRRKKVYYPDIHLYADCSGSMTEENFEGIVDMAATLAAQRNTDLWFTSFSHIMSQDVRIPSKGKSPAQIKAMIRALPKVTGGTDFNQLWDHINKDRSRQQRMNIIATDFEYHPDHDTVHSPNTFYVPCDTGDWSRVTSFIERFADWMIPYDNTIAARILGVY